MAEERRIEPETTTEAGDDDDMILSKTARNLLLVKKSIFWEFAPHFYQYSRIVAKDPLLLANIFLAQATDACLDNLRYVSCHLFEKTETGMELQRIRTLREVICTWKELRNLRRFELVFELRVFYHVFVRDPKSYKTSTDTEGRWAIVDDEIFLGVLVSFERVLLSKTFRGFRPDREISEGEHAPSQSWPNTPSSMDRSLVLNLAFTKNQF